MSLRSGFLRRAERSPWERPELLALLLLALLLLLLLLLLWVPLPVEVEAGVAAAFEKEDGLVSE